MTPREDVVAVDQMDNLVGHLLEENLPFLEWPLTNLGVCLVAADEAASASPHDQRADSCSMTRSALAIMVITFYLSTTVTQVVVPFSTANTSITVDAWLVLKRFEPASLSVQLYLVIRISSFGICF